MSKHQFEPAEQWVARMRGMTVDLHEMAIGILKARAQIVEGNQPISYEIAVVLEDLDNKLEYVHSLLKRGES